MAKTKKKKKKAPIKFERSEAREAREGQWRGRLPLWRCDGPKLLPLEQINNCADLTKK
jgi:hypothetical protein